jgi:arylsulfatase A-like enzyme/uncharacterized membrane protein YbhN (UPF0104 family)
VRFFAEDDAMPETREHDDTLLDPGPPASMEGVPTEPEGPSAPNAPKKRSLKSWVMLALKVAVSAGGLYLVYGQLVGKEGLDELTSRLSTLRWGWFVAAMGMQLIAILFAILRWQTMLLGQGIHARWGFMFPSFMIGRFWGAFTPGGLGLDGWKLYDVVKQTKKPARVIAQTAVEKILGQLAFGIVVMGASVWGLELMGVTGLLMINGFFVVLVTAGLTFVARPALFRPLFRLLPKQIEPRVRPLLTAVSAYHGKGRILAVSVLCGVAVHAFNNLIYVCAAQAMALPITPTVVFFASSIVIMSTIVPLSFNGMGVREATAAGVLATVGGVSAGLAAATYTLGWIAEMCVSSFGILFFVARRAAYDAKLKVERPELEAELEEALIAEVPEVPASKWPSRARGLAIGAGAGLVAGMIVGVAEGAVVVADGGGRVGYGVMAYGAVAYGLLCALGGAAFGLASAWLGRLMQREAVPEPAAYARLVGAMVAFFALALGAFRIRRDVFHEELVWKSKDGLLVLAACMASALVIYGLLAFGLRVVTRAKVGSFLLRGWGSPALVAAVVGGIVGASVLFPPSLENVASARTSAPEGAPNVLFIVVDTLRADHLPAYGYERGRTPNLDRFAEDAVRFDWAFANASWTRPSFASILTGRYASSHGVMGKPDALPDEVVTMPEVLRDGGYRTAGYVTNFNVGPYFNFQQGFDEYAFLEPEFVLGADDSAAKLLLVQALRQGIERFRAARGSVEPGTAYQDAETVNRHVVSYLDRAQQQPGSPFFLFVGYMDPHDPYFPHPYDGTGYARAAHQHPRLDEAPRLRELYDGEITYWDEQFGRLIDDLRRRGLYDDMMIVITSDHGEEFGEHGGFWHGTTLYDEQVRVPLFVKLPRNARAGTHVSHWVQSIDLMPSILRQIGLPIPAGVQGGSLDQGNALVYAEESHEGNVLESVRERRGFEERKIITANAGNPRGLDPVELYEVADDPGEQSNVAEAQRAEVQRLMSVMEQARQRAREGAVQGNETRELDEDTRRQLCRIGYIDAGECCRDGLLTGDPCRGT